jgi:hypothetical protein
MGAGIGAVAADHFAHDAEDYVADDLRDLREMIAGLPPEVQEAARNSVGAVPAGGARKLVMATLAGAPAEEVIAVAGDAPKEFKDLIKRTSELAQGAPQAAAAILAVGERMNQFESDASEAGLATGEITEKVHDGTAGHSSLPAILGGAGLGTGAALLSHLTRKR